MSELHGATDAPPPPPPPPPPPDAQAPSDGDKPDGPEESSDPPGETGQEGTDGDTEKDKPEPAPDEPHSPAAELPEDGDATSDGNGDVPDNGHGHDGARSTGEGRDEMADGDFPKLEHTTEEQPGTSAEDLADGDAATQEVPADQPAAEPLPAGQAPPGGNEPRDPVASVDPPDTNEPADPVVIEEFPGTEQSLDDAAGDVTGDPADPATADNEAEAAPGEALAEGAEQPEGAPGPPGEVPLTEEQIADRISELANEGHATGRHLDVSDEALQKRLGEVRYKDGSPVVYGPNSDYSGLFKGVDQIDPLTGDTTDGENPANKHYCGPYSTRFDRAEDMVRADAYFREKLDASEGVGPTPIADVLGPDAHRNFTGFYRDPANPGEFKSVDFEGGTIRPQYRLDDATGAWKLHTMMIDPAPRRHP
ncbi:hypothetical protein [Streptomyces erythrochromogenes]|uniref:hypothetical protein n=1 Tax=Streptomyces erythrochromogenes TaxID=285574 RepID=UPI0036F51096